MVRRTFATNNSLHHSIEDDGQEIAYKAQALRGVINPTLSGNVANWAPAGLGTARVVRIAPTGGWGITGIDITQFPVARRDGVELDLINTSGALGDAIPLFDQHGGSAGGNQFFCPLQKTYVLYARCRVKLWYYLAASKWAVLADPQTLTATLSVTVPALAAGELGYATVSTVGSILENIPAHAPITASPQADIETAGAAKGGFLSARVSASNTIRCAFVGGTTGGAVNFTFSWQ